MEAALFARMLMESEAVGMAQLQTRYAEAIFREFQQLVYQTIYCAVPLRDEAGREMLYADSVRTPPDMQRLLLTPQRSAAYYGVKAMEEEIGALMTLENLEFEPDQVRMMVRGMPVNNPTEKRIKAIQKSLAFIGEPEHEINEKHIYLIYQTAVQPFVYPEDQLRPQEYYRCADFTAVDERVSISCERLPQCMADLVEFVNAEDGIDELMKAAMIHLYVLYLQPYFSGNELMARLLSLWYLVQRGYPSAMYISFTKYIVQNRAAYEKAKLEVRRNHEESGVLDVTPFLRYYVVNVYHEPALSVAVPKNALEACQKAQDEGFITRRQKALWDFVLSAYGGNEFTETQLRVEFGHVSRSTVAKFLMRFVELGLLEKIRYRGQFRYQVK